MSDLQSQDLSAPVELTTLLQLSDRREPAVVEIAVWIAQGIIDGTLLPGQDLNSVELASRFGSSRTPVREALALLESDGLVEMRARKRPRVSTFSYERVSEVFFLRGQLMSALAEVAVARATASDLDQLTAIVEELRIHARNVDDDKYRWVHYSYFDTIVAVSGNETARTVLNSLFLRTLPVRRALAAPERLQESLAFAELTLSAFERRDGQLASLSVRRSIEAALASVERSDPSHIEPDGRRRSKRKARIESGVHQEQSDGADQALHAVYPHGLNQPVSGVRLGS